MKDETDRLDIRAIRDAQDNGPNRGGDGFHGPDGKLTHEAGGTDADHLPEQRVAGA